jgi:hypothetical protein
VWMAESLHPGLVVEGDGCDDELISLPFAN